MALSDAQMAKMRRLLDEALDLDVAGRRRWLQQLAPEYEELAPALRHALLPEADASSGPDLDTPPKFGAGPGDTVMAVSGLQPGERVGPYQLVRLLGAGGMAQVWLAQRADGAFKRELALKLPVLSRLHRHLAQRFAHERDILAGLEHVNIARFYDAGVTDGGLPYLAMEYVPGEPLTTWCDKHHLGVGERIKLFLQVLDAVQYAHARQVIHRDIKPSNILVTESGQVRLLDFGVAKLLAEDDEQASLTQIYGRALTPDYASPEHLLGEPADVASDIYSLGVVLFEVLAGYRPYRFKTGAVKSMLEGAINETEMQRPSTQLSPEAGPTRDTTQQKLARRLRGDLDAIVLKALSRSPQQRYPSAAALADDLQRYLRGEPVKARPDGLLYRAGKYALRHRTGIAAGAVATLTAAVALLLVQGRSSAPGTDAAAMPTAASVAPEKSIAVLPFLDMSEKKDLEYFSDGLSEEVLDLLSRLPELRVAARTSAFSFKGKLDDIPTIARKLQVSTVLEGSVRRSGNQLRITAQLVRADNGYHLWSQTFDRKLGDIFQIQDEIAAAVVQALHLSLLAESLPKSAVAKDLKAYTLYLEARSLQLHTSTKADWEKVAEYAQRATALDPTFAPAWAFLSGVFSARAQLGYIPTKSGWEAARNAAVRALALDPRLPEAHTAMASILIRYDWNWAAAQAHVEQALAQDPGNTLAMSWGGYLAQALGQEDRAVALYQSAIASDPLDANKYNLLAQVLYLKGRFAEAQIVLRKTLELDRRQPFVHWTLGRIALANGDPEAALVELDREPYEEIRLVGRAIAFHAKGRKSDSDVALAELEQKYAGNDAADIALVHAFRGEIDQAFAWFDRGYQQRDSDCVFVKVDPLLKNIRSDPRYRAFLSKMNLPV